MNLDQIFVCWVGLFFLLSTLHDVIEPIKKWKAADEYYYSIIKRNKTISCYLLPVVLFYFVWAMYYTNYKNGGYDNIAKITLHTCTKDNKTTIEQNCEYIGAITYRPYMRELMITTTPLYPVLNCPNYSPNCVQERIFVDKANVKSLEKIQ